MELNSVNSDIRQLYDNLEAISAAMVGGLEMSVLVQRIVDKIAEVIGAEASSLYLLDPDGQILRIQAATGYQKALVKKGAFYNIQEKGITAWIARKGQSFKANSNDELHAHEEWAGKQNPLQGDREPNAFLGIPLIVTIQGARQVIGVLKVEDIKKSSRYPESYFTEQDELLVEMMGNVITTVIQNTRLNDRRLHDLNENLQTLSAAMVGGLEMSVLVQRIVDKIVDVLGVDASSLYLLDPDGKILRIQAATGYQKALVKKGAFYNIQEKGITAWIAREGQSFKANNNDELHAHEEWAGKQNPLQGNREPNAFLGIPLKATVQGVMQVIGVLKVEDIRLSSRHPESYFTEQDELLVEMMGNVITTVILNTRLNDRRLHEFNANLQRLSAAMMGGLEMAVLAQHIVDRIAEVIGAEASSLYLLDQDDRRTLRIQAAKGYQRRLLECGAFYDIDEKGITPWIAREKKPFRADSNDVLIQHPSYVGKYDDKTQFRKPNAFLGIPLIVNTGNDQKEVIGVLKVEDIQPSSSHLENCKQYFTYQDELLVEMMGNVITTVIQNTRLSDNRMIKILTQVLSCTLPIEPNSMFLDILRPLVIRKDVSVFRAISTALSDTVQDYNSLEKQTRALLSLKADSELFRIMGINSKDETTARWYSNLYQLSQHQDVDSEKILDALIFEKCWQSAKNSLNKTKEEFHKIVDEISEKIAASCDGKSNWIGEGGRWLAFEIQLSLPSSLDISFPSKIPVLFFQGSRWQSKEDIDNLRDILNNNKYLFSWEKIPGNDNGRLIEFLMQKFSIEWAKAAIITKIDDVKTIIVTNGTNSLSLTLNDDKTNANLKIDDGRTDQFIVKTENGELNIYNKNNLGNIILTVFFLSNENMEKPSDDLQQFSKSHGKDIIKLPLEKIQHLISARNSQKLLRSQVLEKINLLTVSPYIISGPIPDKMFYGRENELRQITDNARTTNYAIIGGRRIGKTSILKKLQRDNLPNNGFQAYYHDCSPTPTEAELVKSVTTDRDWFPQGFTASGASFADVVKALPYDKPLVILLDEFDKLIKDNTDYQLFNILRALSNEGKCKFIISGERGLRSELKKPDKPLYNFAENMVIGLLDQNSVKELVTSPMKQLEIELINEEKFVEKIFESTSGHPNVVQRLCRRLIETLNKTGNRRLTLNDVENVITNPKFMKEEILNIFWEKSTSLERICSLVIADNVNVRTLKSVQAAIKSNGVDVDLNSVSDALERLVDLRNILKNSPEGYEFSVTAFPEIISKNQLKDYLALDCEKYQNHGDIVGEVE
jgi:signal transduction protein with GAF and PtsI domain